MKSDNNMNNNSYDFAIPSPNEARNQAKELAAPQIKAYVEQFLTKLKLWDGISEIKLDTSEYDIVNKEFI